MTRIVIDINDNGQINIYVPQNPNDVVQKPEDKKPEQESRATSDMTAIYAANQAAINSTMNSINVMNLTTMGLL